jgi:polar amino acid transport system substrate-binding protein
MDVDALMQKRGTREGKSKTLVVGVDENTLLLSARDPKTGEITGLEIDLARAIAAAIGPDVEVELKPVVTENKTSVVKDGAVDLTVSAVSMTCDRLRNVLFSTEYFTTDQKLLVRNDSEIRHASDLAGKTVCMTAGSSSIKTLATVLEGLDVKARNPMLVPARTDCLVALQEGTADAYFGHETFLYGMAIQDPTVRIVDESQSTQHYGIAIAQGNENFVRFVNGVLEQMRANGSLQHTYDVWLGNNPAVPSVPAVPAAQYKD